MKIIGCQIDIAWGDKPANYERVRAMLSGVEINRPTMIVLPEMFATGFSMNVPEIAEAADGPSEQFLVETARQMKCYVLGGVVSTGPDGRGRNQALACGTDGSELVRYAKIHPFSFAGETQHYTGGEDVEQFEIGPWRIAPFVCYDLRFPEVFRRAVRRGANLLVVIANWPEPRVQHWTSLLIARAIENQAYVVGVNRTGSDPNVAYNGQSLVVDPRGKILVQAGQKPQLVTAELDFSGLEEYRKTFPALADIRPEFFGPQA